MTDGGAAAERPDGSGRVLDGRYRVERVLGAGGMGTVYLARDERMGRPVVVKVPHARLLDDEGFRRRFAHEVRALTDLPHPHVVKVLDAGEAPEEGRTVPVPYAVLEYLDGGSLKERFSRGPSSCEDVLAWLPGVASALDFIHAQGVVHRDVKPGNILFDRSGHAIVADFGIAKALGDLDTGLTQTGATPGSPDYMAPEVALGGSIGPSYDQYALAVVVYEALSGALPHGGAADTPVRVLYRKAAEAPRALAIAAPTVPAAVAHAVMRALARDPGDRYASCTAFAQALRAALDVAVASTQVASAPSSSARGTSPEVARPPGPAVGRATRGPRRRWARLAVAAVALTLGGVAVATRDRWTGAGPSSASVSVAWARVVLEATSKGLDGDWAGATAKVADARAMGATDDDLPKALRDGVTRYEAPPDLLLATPAEGATTVEATIRVAGTLRAGRATDEVYVNGTRVRTGPGAFDVPAEVAAGPFTIRVQVEDGGASRGAAIERRGRREDAPWRAFLSGWAEPVGADLDPVTKYPKRVRRTADGMEMVLIPAGTFPMGAVPEDEDAYDDESPRHSVTLTSAYYVDEHEVTVGMWRTYARATGKTMPELRSEATDAHPMHEVSWEDVQGYLRWANVTLPTEAQWERALRGGTDDFVYPWGATDDAKRRNGDGASDGYDGLAPVKSYSANGYGLYDMSGNAWEWCLDGQRTYTPGPATDPEGPRSAGSARVVRGGSWINDARKFRASTRNFVGPTLADGDLGFRCARGLPAPTPTSPPERSATSPTAPGEDAPWRAFLSGWAEPVGADLDPVTKYPKRVRRTADGMELVLIPAGTFPMGAVPGDTAAYEDEKPRHSVTLTRAYYVDEHEVTVGMWRTYARATGKTMPTLWSGATDAHPIHKVSWEDVQGYVRWAQVALPTEAQWERAARGGRDDFVYPWGATDDLKRRNGMADEDGLSELAPVKSYGANGFGLYDMSGSVLEWCADRYDSSYYGRSPSKDPPGPDFGFSRVVRGGSWYDDARYLRASYRNGYAPTYAIVYLGFRCARSLPAPAGG